MRCLRCLLWLSVLLVLPARAAEQESGLFCPLAVEAHPQLTEPPEALQKRFLSVAREHSGYALLLRKEVEEAVKAAKVTDYAQSDASLSRVARQAKVQNAGYVSLKLTERNELLLEGRVVRADGKLLKAAALAVPRGTQPLLDVLTTATERFFEQLNGTAPVAVSAPPPVPVADSKAPPPQVVVLTGPVKQPNPGTALRVVGLVLVAAGVGTGVAGGVVLANAGTVEIDGAGNISSVDAPRVAGIRAQQGASFALFTAGAALTVTGALMALLAPNAPVTAALAPRSDGAVLVMEGRF